MRKFIDLTGKNIGRWTVIDRAENGRFSSGGSVVKWNCICDCGNTKKVSTGSLVGGKSKSCGCIQKEIAGKNASKRSASNHPSWTGGKSKTKAGYLRITHGINRGVFDHIVVAELMLGRKLTSDETVHHKNGIRDDNRPENLEVKASSHGVGQSIPDLVYWAKEILSRYEPQFLLKCHN